MSEGNTFAQVLESQKLDEAPDAEPVEQEAPAEAQAEPEKAPVREPNGRFAKQGEKEDESPASGEQQEFEGAATIAERRRRQEAEAKIAQMEQQLQQMQQRQQPQQEQQPLDPDLIYTDPAAYTQNLTSQFQTALYRQSLAMSDRFARSQYGDEAVNAALEWGKKRCDEDDYFNRKVLASGDPVGYAIKEYQRDQIVSNVTPDDFAEFQKWREQQAAQPVGQQPQAKPPPTLTGERNLGTRSAPVDTGPSTFGDILNNR